MSIQQLVMPCADVCAPGEERREAFINISDNVKHFATLPEQAQYWDEQAQALNDALYRTLPGAIWERLLSKMLATTASYYVRSFEEVGHG